MRSNFIISETDQLFELAADKLNLDDDLRQVLRVPYREIKVEIPLRDMTGEFYLCHGYRIQHNGARGPYYGGVNLDHSLSREAITAMAARNVFKTALMNVPFGGACGGIDLKCDNTPFALREMALRSYTGKISSLIGPYKDILSTGKNVDPGLMACIMDEYGKRHGYVHSSVTGKPEALSGTAERSMALVTAACYLLDLTARGMQMQLQGMRMAIAASVEHICGFIDCMDFLGCILVAVCDGECTVYFPDGFDLDDLKGFLIQGNRLCDYHTGDKLSVDDFAGIETDILLPGLDPVAINADIAHRVKARLLVELKDTMVFLSADTVLGEKGVVVIPDVLVTSGIVVMDYFEWIQNIQQFRWDYDQVNEEMAKYFSETFKILREYTNKYEVNYRIASYMLALERVAAATRLRGYV